MDAPVGNGSADLSLATTSSWIHQGEILTVPFTVTTSGATGALTVHASGLPAGVTAEDVTVAAGGGDGALKLIAVSAAAVGARADVSVEVHADGDLADAATLTLKTAGAAGDPDTTFGSDGARALTVRDPAGTAPGLAFPTDIAVYPADLGDHAGEVVVAGTVYDAAGTDTSRRPFVARFKTDGSLDTSFGETTANGRRGYYIINDREMVSTRIAIDSMGRIVVGAGSHNRTGPDQAIALYRLTTTGEPDASFTSYYGKPAPAAGYAGELEDLALLPLDKILVSTSWNRPSGGMNAVVSVFSSDGTLDRAFNGSGSVILPPARASESMTQLFQIAVDAQGRYVGVGRVCDGGWNPPASNCVALVARLTAAGAMDASFGSGAAGAKTGFQEIAAGGIFYGMALTAAGDVVASGANEAVTRATIARVKAADGALDPSFASTGALTVDLGRGSYAPSVMLDQAGRLVLIGRSDGVLARLRFDASGRRDAGYGPATVAAVGGGVGALAGDDQLVAAIAVYRQGTSGPTDVVVRRFWP